jgi:hypothetical protein
MTMVRALFIVLAVASASVCCSAELVWDPAFVHDVAPWTIRMNDARVSAGPDGLRVETAEGRDWAIVAAETRPSAPVARLRVVVKELSPGARVTVRLSGDFDGGGREDGLVLIDGMDAPGETVVDLEPRVAWRAPRGLRLLQLGVQDKAGARVLFGAVEFLPPAGEPIAPKTGAQPGQASIECVDLMPNLPEPYRMKDWNATARAFDSFAFDFNATGEYLPFIWLDDARVNIDEPTFGLPSYAGSPQQTPGSGAQEGITCMGAVLGASVSGIDKRRQEHDYVAMCAAWNNRRNGLSLVLNAMNQETGGSFWYELWPHIVFYGLCDKYPDQPGFRDVLRASADRWCDASAALAGPDGVPDFNHTSFEFRAMKPVDNGKWREPDAAAAVAWLEYAAWTAFGDDKYLDAAKKSLAFLQRLDYNPFYEVLLPYGVLAAARCNAERGDAFDVDKLLDWCFGISDVRGGWGVLLGRWGGYDCHGLVGSVDNRGGYAFAMNTFVQAGALVPLARYDTRHARAIGKWMLNAANAARLFYADALSPENQTSAFWTGDPQSLIAYEGLRHRWQGKEPCATGDPIAMNWGPKTDRGLYGSVYAGIFGGIIRTTNVERILQLDCLATDFFHGRAWPTCLYFNPWPETKEIEINVGDKPCDLYDAAGHRFLARNVKDTARFSLEGDYAAVVVIVPANAEAVRDGRKLLLGGTAVDFNVPQETR